MDMSLNDEALMGAFAKGNYESFEVLYNRHKAALMRFYRRQAGAYYSEELLQEAFVRIIKARCNYTPSATFKTYLWTIARSVLIDHYRKSSRTLPASYSAENLEDLIASESVEPDHSAEQTKEVERLMKLVSQLPSAQREVFLLREEGGLTLPEISEITGVSTDTVKSRIRYAIKKLKEGMEVL